VNRALILDLSERTILSIVRTVFYGLLAWLVAHGRAEMAQLLKALVVGAVLADFLTWFAQSLLELPQHLWHGGYDAALYLVFALWFFHYTDLHIGGDGSALGAAFMTFMLVMGLKVGWYGLKRIQADLEAD